ncbi:hypothetical protein K431DRAFT_52777 [Polychaeton citri CBS 116435]|uniref:Copper-fist domain-containing protein n=1 Tax=Polychaeton citri CBS 116435 TaxID=1314669 RepID=A0A9P4QEH0_9PEZI|nr:hypothetical protein K431DRAFT_52777 [Polychaeton citri CBS 116435]
MAQFQKRVNIEVIDANNGQFCKIACMSCIRGHRTTSCGITNCRNKVFWTVKRPGRPSNACNCAMVGGVCICTLSVPICPHKAKRGGKRSVDCRCDEQGRFCCYVTEADWAALTAGAKPRIKFFENREDLRADGDKRSNSHALLSFRVAEPAQNGCHKIPDTQQPATPAFGADNEDLDTFMQQYIMNQAAGAMCQQCGRRNCNCSMCPPVMQMGGTSNWGVSMCCSKSQKPEPASTPAPASTPPDGCGCGPQLVSGRDSFWSASIPDFDQGFPHCYQQSSQELPLHTAPNLAVNPDVNYTLLENEAIDFIDPFAIVSQTFNGVPSIPQQQMHHPQPPPQRRHGQFSTPPHLPYGDPAMPHMVSEADNELLQETAYQRQGPPQQTLQKREARDSKVSPTTRHYSTVPGEHAFYTEQGRSEY